MDLRGMIADLTLGSGVGTPAFAVLFYNCRIAWLDVVAIILILPDWHCDVPSFEHARLIRRGVASRRFKPSH
jgi:hypothetical protein